MILSEVFILSWLITHFKPLTWCLDLLPDKLLFNLLKLLLTCLTCVSFWFGLVWCHDIVISATASFIGFWYDKIFGYYENRIRLK